MRPTHVFLTLMLSATCCTNAFAQDIGLANHNGSASAGDGHSGPVKPDEHFYRLTFRVLDIGSEKTAPAAHSYSQLIRTQDDQTSQIRSRDHYNVEDVDNEGKSYTVPYDVGTNIDIRHASDDSGSVHLHVVADITSIPAGTIRNGVAHGTPISRENKWESSVIVPTGKPTIIFSSDDAGSDGKTELELTATPVH